MYCPGMLTAPWLCQIQLGGVSLHLLPLAAMLIAQRKPDTKQNVWFPLYDLRLFTSPCFDAQLLLSCLLFGGFAEPGCSTHRWPLFNKQILRDRDYASFWCYQLSSKYI